MPIFNSLKMGCTMLDSLDTLIAFTLIMLVVSLLITIAVQMVSAALSLRGKNLARGLANTFVTILPKSQKEVDGLIDHLLKDPILSDSWLKKFSSKLRLATVVRSDEVFDAIHRIAIGKAGTGEQQAYAKNLLIALGMDEVSQDTSNVIDTTKRIADKVDSALKELLEKAPPELGPARDAVEQVTAELKAFAKAEADRVAQSATVAAAAIDNAYQKFQYWCDTAQERAQQRFAMNTRLVTIFFAIIFSFVLQLDTFEIYKFVSTNRAAREKLVAQASAVASHAEEVFNDNPGVLKEALASFKDKQTENDVMNALKPINYQEDDTRGSLSRRVNEALKVPRDKKTKIIEDIDTAIDEVVASRLKNQAGHFKTVAASIDQTGFNLIPSGQTAEGKSWRWGNNIWDGIGLAHFFGMLFTAGLLSLGAPFWYNILKNLTSLRSMVAGKISDEQKEARRQPEAAGGRSAPPTVAPPK